MDVLFEWSQEGGVHVDGPIGTPSHMQLAGSLASHVTVDSCTATVAVSSEIMFYRERAQGLVPVGRCGRWTVVVGVADFVCRGGTGCGKETESYLRAGRSNGYNKLVHVHVVHVPCDITRPRRAQSTRQLVET